MNGRVKKSLRENQISNGANVGISLIFILLGLICTVPLVLIVMISFSSESSLSQFGYRFIPKGFSLEAYEYLWKNRQMLLQSLKITIIVTVVGGIMGLFFTTSMGYVLSRKEYKFNKFFSWVVFIPMVFNGGIISTYFINKTVLNLGDTLWALILPLLVSSFNVIICRTFFATTIPNSVIESAKIDGASQMKIYFRIVLPISLPLLATIALFLIFGYWNDWWQALLYIDDAHLKPTQSLLMSIEQNIEYILKYSSVLGSSQSELLAQLPRESFRMAIAVVIILPVSLAYPFFQRYFISGLTVGAVKG